jgi:hypothetical protein
MVEFEGKLYMIDVDKLMKMISEPREIVKDKSKVETWAYAAEKEGDDPELRVIQKEITENTSNAGETFGNIRYDFMKNLLNLVVSPISDEAGSILRINSFEDMYFGQVLAFNTLINEGIIIEVTED